ncbi:putative selenate ABC transporter substrate-binding protein [Microbulbifer yueqingensis]|uniref:Phosphonate transport system substrate-binding protein n=1 Tax=Microbulbifer yueqingensis TaxID=658219 RepID=A0A1G9DIS2_9GAMM|nr:putative selenate ABC transporter substrate-binding protein [Microbulbifer yueqingensis]SDK63768.1 phosphonate transport system substrate-binding protein [Microbulbifer yueqingensis]
MRYLTAILALLASLSGFAADTARPQFTFTAIPDQNEAELVRRFQQVADYLSGELGLEVRYVPVKSYPAAITAFRGNQVQLAWFGGLSGVQARRAVPGSEAIAQGYEDQFFKTYFIAHESTGIAPGEGLPEAIAGRTFTFGSKGSTSGRLMPEFHIREAFGRAPGEVFDRVGFSGDHSRTIALVQSGAYEVGAVNYAVWDKAVARGEVDTDRVSVIWTTPAYADYQWTVRGDIDQQFGAGFKARLTRALLELDNEEILGSFPRSRFVPADNSVYSAIEETATEIGLLDDF